MFPSYRNQSVNLPCKSTDWFLYDGNNVRLMVKFNVKFGDNDTINPKINVRGKKKVKRVGEGKKANGKCIM